jgi:UDP-N-acetylmuramoylalanine--D-glutamate ligase
VELADAIARAALAAPAPPPTLAAPAPPPTLAAAGGKAAVGPATVLLSPAAASFDMFADYAARGAAFRAAVEAIARRRALGGSRR